MYRRAVPHFDLSKIVPKPRIISHRKINEKYFQTCIQLTSDRIDTAELAESIAELTGTKGTILPETVYSIKGNIVSAIITPTVHVKNMDAASEMTKIGDGYADTAGQLWSVVDSDDGRHLVRETDDDLAEILGSLADFASVHGVTKQMTTMQVESRQGDFAGAIIDGKVKFGFILDGLLVDTLNSTIDQLDKAGVFYAIPGRVAPLSKEASLDVAKLTKAEKELILEYFKAYYPDEFVTKLRKMLNG